VTGTLIAPVIPPLLPRPVPGVPLPLPGPCRWGSRSCARRRFGGTWCTGSPTSTAPAAWPTGRSPARWAGAAGDRLTLTAEAGVVVIRRDAAECSGPECRIGLPSPCHLRTSRARRPSARLGWADISSSAATRA
jgi:hypothetical protein